MMKWWTEQISNFALYNSKFWYSVIPSSRANLRPLLTLSFSSNTDLNKLTMEQWKYSIYLSNIRTNPFFRFIILSEICFLGVEAVDENCFFYFSSSPMWSESTNFLFTYNTRFAVRFLTSECSAASLNSPRQNFPLLLLHLYFLL